MVRNRSQPVIDVQMNCLEDGKASIDGIWRALGKLLPCSGIRAHKLIKTADMMQQISNDINKMKRLLLNDSTIAVLRR